MTPDQRVEEIRQRLAAATANGSWEMDDGGRVFIGKQKGCGCYITFAVGEQCEDCHAGWPESEFITHAPTDLAFLLSDRSRAITEAVERIANEIEHEADIDPAITNPIRANWQRGAQWVIFRLRQRASAIRAGTGG